MGRLTKNELKEFNEENHTKFKLTTYHKDLYEFIRHNSERGIKTTVKMVCDFLPDYYQVNITKHNYSNCPDLYEDIDYMNRSPEILKIIVKDNNNFKLATKEEATEYAEKMRNRGLKLLAKAGVIKVKAKRDKQGYLPDLGGENIEGESDSIEAFIKESVREIDDELRELDCQIVCSRLAREQG